MKMAKWMNAKKCVPNHEDLVEIACYEPDNNPPFWRLSHAWFNNIRWIRKIGEDWEIEYWRESIDALRIEKPWKEETPKESSEIK